MESFAPNLEAADQELPLYGLLRRIADESLDDSYRDVLRIAVLPYLHAMVPPALAVKPTYLLSDAELLEVQRAQAEHEKQVRLSRGRLRAIEDG